MAKNCFGLSMRVSRFFIAVLCVVMWSGAALPQGRPRPFADPNDTAAKVVERIEQGDIDGLARLIGLLMGLDTSDGQAEIQFRQIALMGKAMFFERVYEQTLGSSLRQMIYYAPFRNERGQLNFGFFNLIFMRGNEGWYFTWFQFKQNHAYLIPPSWIPYGSPPGQ